VRFVLERLHAGTIVAGAAASGRTEPSVTLSPSGP
jgi:hypothetical protein